MATGGFSGLGWEGCEGGEVGTTGCAGASGLLGEASAGLPLGDAAGSGASTGAGVLGVAEGANCHGRCCWWLAFRVRLLPLSCVSKQAMAAVGTPTMASAPTPMTIFL